MSLDEIISGIGDAMKKRSEVSEILRNHCPAYREFEAKGSVLQVKNVQHHTSPDSSEDVIQPAVGQKDREHLEASGLKIEDGMALYAMQFGLTPEAFEGIKQWLAAHDVKVRNMRFNFGTQEIEGLYIDSVSAHEKLKHFLEKPETALPNPSLALAALIRKRRTEGKEL